MFGDSCGKARSFQRGCDFSQARRNRLDNSLSLRKKERQERLQKRRRSSQKSKKTLRFTNNNNTPPLKSSSNNNNNNNNNSNHNNRVDSEKDQIISCVEKIRNGDARFRLPAIVQLRKFLSAERDPPTKTVMDTGVCQTLSRFLDANFPLLSQNSKNYNSNEEQKLKYKNRLYVEILWCITNLSAGDEHAICCEKIAQTPRLVGNIIRIVQNTNDGEVQAQCVWALGNIAGDRADYKYSMLKEGLMNFIVSNWDDFDDETQRQSIWVISNLCRGDKKNSINESEYWHYKKDCLPLIAKILSKGLDDEEYNSLLSDCLWSVVYLTNESQQPSEPAINFIVENTDIIDSIVQILYDENSKYEKVVRQYAKEYRIKLEQFYSYQYSNNYCSNNNNNNNNNNNDGNSNGNRNRIRNRNRNRARLNETINNIRNAAWNSMNGAVLQPSLRFLGNVVSGENDDYTQVVLDAGYLNVLYPFLQSPNSLLRRETFWSISNIMAGTTEQIQKVLTNQKLLNTIVDKCINDIRSVGKEALWCVNNCLSTGDVNQVLKLRQKGCIHGLIRFLNDRHEPHIKLALEGIEALLSSFNDDENQLEHTANEIEELKGLDRLEELQTMDHISDDVYQFAKKLVQQYWPDDGDAWCEEAGGSINTHNYFNAQMLAPKTNELQHFVFGTQSSLDNKNNMNNNENINNNNHNNHNGKTNIHKQAGSWVF